MLFELVTCSAGVESLKAEMFTFKYFNSVSAVTGAGAHSIIIYTESGHALVSVHCSYV